MWAKIAAIAVKCLYPLLKMAKPRLKRWANDELIPELQKKINAGAIDEKVDGVIKEVITGAIEIL